MLGLTIFLFTFLFYISGYAEDYYLDAKSQCAGTRGSCPDSNLALGRNDVKLLNSAIINEFTMLTYRRPLGKDDQYDSAILTNQSQSIIWAMGPINNKVIMIYLIIKYIITKISKNIDLKNNNLIL